MNTKDELNIIELINKGNYFENNPKDKYFWSFDLLVNNHNKASKSRENIGIDIGDVSLINENIEFLGYTKLIHNAKVIKLIKSKSKKSQFTVVFDKTPFYPEGGGQCSDTGIAYSDKVKAKINYVYKKSNVIFHECEIISGNIADNDKLFIKVDVNKRTKIMKNHSATHLLHSTLKEIFGKNVSQQGSSIYYDRFRFDFNYIQKKLNTSNLPLINKLVNEKILLKIKANIKKYKIADAKRIKNIEMNFQEKYDNEVRVINFDKYSVELCSGTHVNNTKDIQMFFITNIQKKASNIYRVYAITSFETIYSFFFPKFEEFISTFKNVSSLINNAKINIKIPFYFEKMKQLYKICESLIVYKNFTSKNGFNFITTEEPYKIDEYISIFKRFIKKYEKSTPENLSKLVLNQKIYSFKNIKYIINYFNDPDFNTKLILNLSDNNLCKSPDVINIFQKKLNTNAFFTLVSCNSNKYIPTAKSLFEKLTEKFGGKGGGNARVASGKINKIILQNDFCEILKNISN